MHLFLQHVNLVFENESLGKLCKVVQSFALKNEHYAKSEMFFTCVRKSV